MHLNWLAFLIVGFIVYGITYAPVFPSDWTRFARFVGGILILVGFVFLLLVLFNVGVPR